MCLFDLICDFVTIDDFIKAAEICLAIWGCLIAKEGLSTWKNQVIETPKIELAREIMESFYNVTDLIKDVRRNMRSIDIDKLQEYFSKTKLNEIQCRFLEHLYEINQSSELLINFQKLKNKAKVNFEDNLDDDFVKIIRIINEIKEASSELCHYYRDEKEAEKLYHTEIENYKKTLYQRDNDKINNTLKLIIEDVEKKLKPIYGCRLIKKE